MSAAYVSNINGTGMIFIVISGLLAIILPRRFAFLPLLVSACYMTLAQQLVIAPFHFSAERMIITFGWIRVLLRRDHYQVRLTSIDKVIIWWVVVSFSIYVLAWQSSEAIVNRLGFAYNVVGLYFFFRLYIGDLDDVNRVIKVVATLAVPLAFLMLIEGITGRNFFSILGAQEVTPIRDGSVRCQGPFAHSILAGTFGATSLPLFVTLCLRGGSCRLLGIMGSIAATIITVASTSSGPVVSCAAGIIGLTTWRLRKHMRAVRWGLLFGVISLHIIMKAPVWALVGRMSSMTGGTGWHRVHLINAAISNFEEWWLLGTKTTSHWLDYRLPSDSSNVDITSQFILEGVSGGLWELILFIAIIVYCFKTVGDGARAAESKSRGDGILVWSLGAALLSHVTAFISVSYFDQMIVFWYVLLAMIASVNGLIRQTSTD
jgi:hypothetical protein